jgi:hypothetical protein
VQPVSQTCIEGLSVSGGKRPDDLDHQPCFHRGDLSFDSRGDVQARRAPLLDGNVRVGQYRGNRDEKKIGTVLANDDGRADLAACQIRERNRQEDDVIS